jgi:Tfp pilus assembly protein PilO
MSRLLTNMEPRTVALLMVSTAILVAAALGRFIIWPEVQSYNKSRTDLTSLESVASQQNSLDTQVKILEGRLSALQQQLHGDMVNLPDNQMESFVIGQLQRISWKNRIELLGVRPGKGSVMQGLEETLFTVEIAGDYFDLYAWLQELIDELGFVVIKNFSIRPLDTNLSGPRLIATLTIASYREAGNA